MLHGVTTATEEVAGATSLATRQTGVLRDQVEVETGDRLGVDIVRGTVTNLTSGKTLETTPPPEFLLEMLRAGGLIPFLGSNPPVMQGLGEISQ